MAQIRNWVGNYLSGKKPPPASGAMSAGGGAGNVLSGTQDVARFAKSRPTGSGGGVQPQPAASAWHPQEDQRPRYGYNPRYAKSAGAVETGAMLGSGGGSGGMWAPAGGGRRSVGGSEGGASRPGYGSPSEGSGYASPSGGSSYGGPQGFPGRDNRSPPPNIRGQLQDATNKRSPWFATTSIHADVGFGPNCEENLCSRCRNPLEPDAEAADENMAYGDDGYGPDGVDPHARGGAGDLDVAEQMDDGTAMKVEDFPDEWPAVGDGDADGEEKGDKVLESVIRVLIETESGRIKAKRLCKKAKIKRSELEEIIDAYPGILVQDAESNSDDDSGSDFASRVTSVASNDFIKLVPTLYLCSAHNGGKKGCEDKRCRKLHLCKNFALEQKCAAFKRGKCRREHRFSSDHNLRVLRRELEVPNLTDVLSAKLVFDLLTYCIEDNGTDADEESDASSEDDQPRRSDRRSDTDSDDDSDGGPRRDRNGGRGGQKQARRDKPARGRRDDSDEDRSRSSASRANRGRGGEDSGNKARASGRAGREFVSRGNERKDTPPQSKGTEAFTARYDVLCADYAKGRCSAERCKKFHGRPNKLYMWQVTDKSSGENWVNLSGNQSDQVEVAFANVSVDKLEVDPPNPTQDPPALVALMGQLTWEADFDNMTMTTAQSSRPLYLRRVGSYPLVIGGGDTKWQWFFESEKGDWTMYGKVGGELLNSQVRSNLSSDDIEEHFVAELKKKGGPDFAASPEAAAVSARPIAGLNPLKFSAVFNTYELDFTRMLQKNVNFKTERKVRRRPAPQE